MRPAHAPRVAPSEEAVEAWAEQYGITDEEQKKRLAARRLAR